MSDVWPDAAVVLQVYPRSFADSDGDGIGDLEGMRRHVNHLVGLGIDAVWLNPFYPSPLADGGYDVSDPRAVDVRLGTLDDFDALLAELHSHGIRVIVDIVPNHVSVEHPWFVEALRSAPGSAARARFHFRDGLGDLPPNDWRSAFGGPAWTRIADGQWYFHLHAPEQPDLNWEHPEVRADLLATLRFWADHGVDGFRIDVANTLLKDLDSPMPWAELELRGTGDGLHPTSDRSGLDELHHAWREVLDAYQPPRMAVAEAAVSRERRRRYAQGLGQAFDFDMQDADFTAAAWRGAITRALDEQAASGRPATWLMGSHDTPRAATRYGIELLPGLTARATALRWLLTDGREPAVDDALGARRVRAGMLLQMALPGVLYLFQGDELGLPEVGDLPAGALQDPLAQRSGGAEKGRDGTRIPLPWNRERTALGGSSFGFGPGGAHLPQPDWFGQWSVEAQLADPCSTLRATRRAIAARRLLDHSSPVQWLDDPAGDDVLHLARTLADGRRVEIVANMGTAPVEIPTGAVLITSDELVGGLLPPDTTAWIARA